MVGDHCSLSTLIRGVRLSVAPVDRLHKADHRLDVPTDGPYTLQDRLYACEPADGRVAVISGKKHFIDLYDNRGE